MMSNVGPNPNIRRNRVKIVGRQLWMFIFYPKILLFMLNKFSNTNDTEMNIIL